MASEEKSVDVSVLEELIDLRKQQELVDQFCARAEEMKAKVERAVYDRVLGDYAARKRVLEEQAAPLVTRALAEYGKLRAIHERIQRIHDAAQLDNDEIDFRHSLGEIDDATRQERLVAPERVLAESDAELATLDAQDVRFREALPNVDLSAMPAESEPPPEPAPPAEASVEESAAVAASEPASADAGATEEVPELTFIEIAPDGEPHDEEHTLVAPDAMLVSEADNGQAVNFALPPSTYIGRAEDNQLRILDPGISRRHVLITATPAGYTIRDLKSQNGTYVNGERIDETSLSDGDRITIGEISLIFRQHAPDARRHAP